MLQDKHGRGRRSGAREVSVLETTEGVTHSRHATGLPGKERI